MVKNKIVKDMMIPLKDYPFISATNTLFEAIVRLRQSRIVSTDGRPSLPRALLVFNDAKELLGQVRRRDIMRGLMPQYLVGKKCGAYSDELWNMGVDVNIAELSYDKIAECIRERSSLLVKDVMEPIGPTINVDDHLVKAVNETVAHDAHLLPVLEGGKVVGALRTVDVLREIALLLEID